MPGHSHSSPNALVIGLLLMTAAVPGPLRAADAESDRKEAAGKTPATASGEIDKETMEKARNLVKQLGDAGYDQREAAHQALAGLGKQAKPALEEGAKSKDAEIADRCNKLLERLGAAEGEVPEIPEGLRKQFRSAWDAVWAGGGAGASSGIRISISAGAGGGVVTESSMSGGTRSRTIGNPADGKLTITIEQEGAVKLTLTPKEGEPKTYNYSASNKEDFSKKYPKFHERYLR